MLTIVTGGVFGQSGFFVRFEWGLQGAAALRAADAGPPISLFVVVDVLSFTTAVSVACDQGVEVFPFPWQDVRAETFARSAGATLAGSRREGGLSLSPASLRASSGVSRIVLLSPNGATICHALGDAGYPVVAACLRNATAVGRWIAVRPDAVIAVIAAGERWPNGSMRAAVEDYWGAGAVIAAVLDEITLAASPEALAAANAFRSVAGSLGTRLADCVSGRELAEQGFGSDVVIAAELDSSGIVPRLVSGRFIGA